MTPQPAAVLDKPTVKKPLPCPSEFCKGYLVKNPNYIDDYGNGELHCSVCGKTAAQAEALAKEIRAKNQESVTQVPTKPCRMRKRSIYIQNHLNEIRNDLLQIGNKAVIKKWGISSSTIHQLRHKGLLPRAHHYVKHGDAKPDPTPPPSVNASVNHTDNEVLPAFPEFKDSWDKDTQIKWLEVYVQLKGKVPA